ncbi:MAG: hypothetical protein M3552_09485, partial [Planctomycetota bacterium]|nr:hypothetical protein [Planctomycetota bacterium]
KTATGRDAFMTEAEATEWQGWFVASAYFFPMLGAIVSDVFLGKYRTILYLSILYCFGHATLALTLQPELLGGIVEPKVGLAAGLAMIALGTGAIKPCVSAHVGDQFGARNTHLLGKVYDWFYFSINFGSTFSTLLTPWLLVKYGPDVAFGVPGILMAIATFVFWLGRNRFVHVPPRGVEVLKETFGPVGRRAIANLALIYVFIAMFWSLFDQTASRWVEQAKHMDRAFSIPEWLPDWSVTWTGGSIVSNAGGRAIEYLPSQFQAVNPILVMILIPFFSYAIYPAINRVFPLTALRKMAIGMFVMVPGFAISAVVQSWIDAGQTPDIGWQLLAYVLVTSSEVMVSITGLEFSYTQAPRTIKSVVMSVWLLMVTLGNAFTAIVNRFISNGTLTLDGADYYWFFTWSMLGAAVLFVGATLLYRGRTYVQTESAEPTATVTAKYCPVCGTPLPAGAVECPKCGETVKLAPPNV